MGAVGVLAGARRASVASHDGVATALWPHGRLPASQRLEGDCQGPHLPAARRHGEGYARLAQDTSAEGAGRDPQRRDQWAADGEGGRGARQMEGAVERRLIGGHPAAVMKVTTVCKTTEQIGQIWRIEV